MKYFIYVMCVLMTLSIPVEITSRKAVNISGEIDVNLCKEPVEFEGKIIYPPFIREEVVKEEINIEEKYEKEIIYISKTVWGEARGCSKVEQAAIVWCILNRVDSSIRYMPDDIIGVVTQKNQFLGYSKSFPVTKEIRELVIDVLSRWEREKAGEENVGRILPPEYMWFYGDGWHNHFRDSYRGGNRWDWSLDNPYEVKGERK